MLEQICDSPIWTQSQSWDTQSPTLSSCMIETAFVWLPAIFLFLCIPYMIWDCLKSNKKSIHWNYYNISRLLITIVCTGIALSKLILCFCRKYQWDDNPTTGHLISTVVQTTTRLILCIVFYCHRKYGIHYSGCIWTYLVLDTILGSLSVATFATQVMRLKYEFILYCIQFSLTVIILLFCSFADQLPPNSDNTETNDDNICPEDKASFPSKLTFHWMNNLLIKFLKQKSLKITDIWPVRHKNIKNQTLYVQLI
ncbi:multidrug resistance-associated protein 1-like [Oppia nitens]|uniref:multidrug resistance-associated protein 1-like n=1 Tax=Oppia nitens TaxID=1686743 RepID=UPI0023DBFD5C|nr:multidrug resistance-associated protein 1-like [Oppia nitens]